MIEIDATIVRVKGKCSVLQERAKSDAGWRVIAVPDHIVEMLRRRMSTTMTVTTSEMAWVLSPSGEYRQVPAAELWLIFASELGGVRDPSNVQRSCAR